AVLASERAVVTGEEVLVAFVGGHAYACGLTHWTIAAIAVVPGGALPSYAHGYYGRDNRAYREWDRIAADRERFSAWMEAHVLQAGPEVFAERVQGLRS